ncbi:iron ABC transporter permease [Aeribacillus pallidus]|uniref:FecCD family ABC transporter permease n=1 Tax=Aeribacillus pallidus TaxID=33936 RepID=UPI001023B706|nr:iron ABC transporter permease [Aeribacillus pallidus]RZI51396.1 iron ABC transporter permease [Aeribacillus pallidus]
MLKNDSASFFFKFIFAVILLIGSFFLAMVFGAADTSVKDVWLALTTDAAGKTIDIIREIRLPREVGAIFVGASLSVAGAIMQGLTRNPLADPGLLGLTAGANAALALTIALFPNANYFSMTIVCFIGAAAGAFLVFGIGAVKKGRISPFQIVLAGAAVSAFLFAVAEGISLYFNIYKNVSMWTAGGLVGATWKQLKILIPIALVGITISLFFSRQLTIVSLNEEVAVGLGQKTAQIKMVLFIIIILLTGASVALVGNMAFIGLMVPHIVRSVVGADYRYILPMSAIFGACFLLIADTLARTINAPYETPVAAIVSFLGLPFFLFIVQKRGKAIT